MKQCSKKLLSLCLSSLISASQIIPVYAAESEEHIHDDHSSETVSESEVQVSLSSADNTGSDENTVETGSENDQENPAEEPGNDLQNNQSDGVIDDIIINPLYENILNETAVSSIEQNLEKENSTQKRRKSGVSTYSVEEDDVTYYTEPSEAAPYVRQAMENRETEVSFHYAAPSYSKELMVEIIDEALEHTGISTQGDYLKWQYGGVKFGGSYYTLDGTAYMDLKYTFSYYTTVEQEEEVSSKLDEVYDDLALDEKTVDQKTDAIYRYICDNVSYSYETLNDPSLTIGFTAYGALINGSSVCQGYSVLFYRMLLDQNIDCRFISGKGNGESHGWNIVRMDNLYYLADATWDAGSKDFTYFLKGSDNFPSHEADTSYKTAEFTEKYPVSRKDYILCLDPQYKNGTIVWSDDYESASAVFTCEVCGRKTEIPAEISKSVTEADCTHNGQTVYTAAADYMGVSARDEKTVVTEAYGHEYQAAFEWKDDFSSASAVFTCSRCQDKQTVPAEIQVIQTTESDCKTAGQKVYEATASLKDKNGTVLLTETDTRTETLPLKAHEYSGVIEWNEDHSSASGLFTCKNCKDHQTVAASLSESVIKEATCTEKGSKTVTAEAALKDENGNELATVKDSVTLEIPALEHEYNGVIEWNDDHTSASGLFTCRNCKDQQTVAASLSESVIKEATCTEKGSKTVTAEAVLRDENGNELASAKDSVSMEIPSLEHSYSGTIEWSEDRTSAFGLFTCRNCSDQKKVNAVLSESITKEATCTEKGSRTITAKAVLKDENGTELASASDSRTEEIPLKEHEYVDGICVHCLKEEPASSTTNPFRDVPENEWYYGVVMTAYERNLMTGLSEGIFGPDENISRGMVAVILWRMSGAPEVTFERIFDDVRNPNDYYAQAVTWAANEGLISGYDVREDGKKLFGPDDNVTREQLAVFFCRYASYKGKDTSARNDLSWFEDKDSVSPYALTAMQWMVGEGMIQGEGGKRLNPLGEAQRSHMAKFSVLMDDFVRNPDKDK